ncbi:YgiW/YdeI family stress tolerance OB fold protein [Campylobacter sp. VBCF_01 NA2]|uniref:YgiW/YdeI family stress tolerance OB fold protein n=1 Tax=Campylobacter sp. VBCF_01 NA2 TaxID=2983836 RepID=UPI0022E9CD10|nr:NirD/YgiW/YdeI family stress tolerance protein [Campylobacter sp. VBCF_01 NA2]WBR53589.1 NirD/YgiW/YdeI family stress tolerance protein [Campylobacter sp. VBCF_01 NA2]
MVKKFLILSAVCAFALAKGGFVGNDGSSKGEFVEYGAKSYRVVSVKEAKDLRDDTKVTLVGNIKKRLNNDDKYLFVDKSGASITVDIDDDDWNGLVVSPDTKIRIVGEVDKDLVGVEIDVDDVLPVK